MASQRPRTSHRVRDKVRLAYLVSHPIQYQAPLLRRIAQEPDIDLTVFFGSDFSVRPSQTIPTGWRRPPSWQRFNWRKRGMPTRSGLC